jgi:hypothetical protein
VDAGGCQRKRSAGYPCSATEGSNEAGHRRSVLDAFSMVEGLGALVPAARNVQRHPVAPHRRLTPKGEMAPAGVMSCSRVSHDVQECWPDLRDYGCRSAGASCAKRQPRSEWLHLTSRAKDERQREALSVGPRARAELTGGLTGECAGRAWTAVVGAGAFPQVRTGFVDPPGRCWTPWPCSTRKRSQVRFLHAPPRRPRISVRGFRLARHRPRTGPSGAGREGAEPGYDVGVGAPAPRRDDRSLDLCDAP